MDFSVYSVEQAAPLRNEQHNRFLRAESYKAKKRIWAASFIVNPVVGVDTNLAVRALVKSFAYAHWRNVDVRLLIGQSQLRSIRIANRTAYDYARSLELPVRVFRVEKSKSLHSKYVVFDDDMVVLGSHNMTPGAAGSNREDSICLRSYALNTLLSDEFDYHWNNALRNDRDA